MVQYFSTPDNKYAATMGVEFVRTEDGVYLSLGTHAPISAAVKPSVEFDAWQVVLSDNEGVIVDDMYVYDKDAAISWAANHVRHGVSRSQALTQAKTFIADWGAQVAKTERFFIGSLWMLTLSPNKPARLSVVGGDLVFEIE